jgi:hypothetical protein
MVTTAISRRKTTVLRLATALASRSRARWRALLDHILFDGEGWESPLEWRYRDDVDLMAYRSAYGSS